MSVARQIGALSVATVVSPFLVAFPITLSALVSGDSVGIHEPLDLLKSVPLGVAGLTMFGAPTFILAALLAWLLDTCGCRSPWPFTASGAGLGALFVGWIFFEPAKLLFEQAIVMASGAVSGAICGWIYWCIALRGREDA